MDEGYFKHYRDEYKKNCSWKYYKGKCIIHEMKDDFYHKSHVEIIFEFVPLMAK